MARQIIDLQKARKRYTHQCPECGGAVTRVPRSVLQRLLVVIHPAKRYRCANSSCGWEGLLRSRQYQKRRRQFLDNTVTSLFANTILCFGVLAVLIFVFIVLILWASR